MKKSRSHLTKKQMNMLKEKLIDEGQKTSISQTISSKELNLDQQDCSDEVDKAVADSSNSEKLRFLKREAMYEKKLKEALNRIDKEDFGVCEDCSGFIRFERLLARPTAKLCISCKEESEKLESGSIFGRQSKSLGKVINFAQHSI